MIDIRLNNLQGMVTVGKKVQKYRLKIRTNLGHRWIFYLSANDNLPDHHFMKFDKKSQIHFTRRFALCGIITFLLFSLIIFISEDAQAMFGLFKNYDVEMSSPVKGRVTNHGKPMANLTINRSLVYQGYKKGEEQLETVKTDQDGRFSFPEFRVKSKYPGDIFGSNFGVQQAIYFEVNGKLYRLWASTKGVPELNYPKLADLLLNLNGDMENQQVTYEFETKLEDEEYPIHHNVYSICYWEREDMQIYYNDEPISSFSEIKDTNKKD